MTKLYRVSNSSGTVRGVLAHDENHLKELCLKKHFIRNINRLVITDHPVDGVYNKEQSASLLEHAKNDKVGFLLCRIDKNSHNWIFDY
jgi:hypothetical protein